MSYTPTTQQVEDGFAHEPEYEYHNPVCYGSHVQSNRRAFKRWLAAHDADVAAKTLEDAANKWTQDAWAKRTPPRGSSRAQIILGMTQSAGDFMLARAAGYRKAVES